MVQRCQWQPAGGDGPLPADQTEPLMADKITTPVVEHTLAGCGHFILDLSSRVATASGPGR